MAELWPSNICVITDAADTKDKLSCRQNSLCSQALTDQLPASLTGQLQCHAFARAKVFVHQSCCSSLTCRVIIRTGMCLNVFNMNSHDIAIVDDIITNSN